jgi:hypothetical protein
MSYHLIIERLTVRLGIRTHAFANPEYAQALGVIGLVHGAVSASRIKSKSHENVHPSALDSKRGSAIDHKKPRTMPGLE